MHLDANILQGFEMDKENLLVDRFNLLRKLKVTELRLEIRNLELKALYNNQQFPNHQVINNQRSVTNSTEKQHFSNTDRSQRSATVIHKKRPGITTDNQSSDNIAIKAPKKTPLISLSTLADGLLKSSQPLNNNSLENTLRVYEPRPTLVYEKRRFTTNTEGKKYMK